MPQNKVKLEGVIHSKNPNSYPTKAGPIHNEFILGVLQENMPHCAEVIVEVVDESLFRVGEKFSYFVEAVAHGSRQKFKFHVDMQLKKA